ncbi:MAG: PD-(D/E)XK nuclease family transposase [Bacteroidales bacterium]|nr:PD-(D/E)XK nuclease family transposase [Bacteroidales bacterium]
MTRSNPPYRQAGKYACVLYDTTFKVVLVRRENEELIRRIIELLIPGKRISHLTFIDKEQKGLVISEKNTNFDLLCKDEATGEEFIVEMQFGKQNTYRERMLSYATYPIRTQLAEKLTRYQSGESLDKMDYSLRPVYVLSFLNFALEHEGEDALDADNGLISRYAVRNDRNGELMTDALHFIYVEMDRFPYKENEEEQCKTLLEKFVFSLKYMHTLTDQPGSFTEDLLRLLYRATELGSMTIEQRERYEETMRNELDISLEKRYVKEEAFKEGEVKGREEGREESLKTVAQKMLAAGSDLAFIKEMTGVDLS